MKLSLVVTGRFALTMLVITIIFTSAIGIAAQRRTASKPSSQKKGVATKGIAQDELPIPPDLIPREDPLGQAYKTGQLPAPMITTITDPSAQATELAAAIAAADENSTAAFMAALKRSGYGIRDNDGNVDYDQSVFQGLALDAWQVATIAKMYGNGVGIGLARFSQSLSYLSPAWKKETNEQELVQAIRDAAASDKPATRFWGTLIIELGQYAEIPYDLRLDDEVKSAKLDAIQISLILTRLGADVNFAASRRSARAENVEQFQRSIRGKEPRMIGASERSNFHSMADEPQLPCTKSELEQLILDLHASGTGIVFGKFLEHFEEGGVISKAPGQVVGAANAALIVLKLIMTYAALEAEISLDGGVLTRTKTTEDGEKKALQAKVKLDIGKWQIVNCLRAAANTSGIDFSLPGDGALGGVRVDWNLMEGGRTRGNIHAVRKGANIASDQIVYLDTQTTAEPDDKGKHYNYTNKDGVSKIFAVGMKQPVDLSGKSTRPVMKRMSVDLDIQIKTMKVKDATTGVGTANDLAGNAFAFYTADILGGVAGTAAETAYRANLGSSKVHTFPVKDWVPCDGGWRGTITYQRVLFNEAKTESMAENKTFRKWIFVEKDLYSAKISISPGTKAEIMNAVAQITYQRDYFKHYVVSNENTCGNRGRTARWWETEIQRRRWKGSATADASVSLGYNSGKYSLSVNLPQIDVEFDSSHNVINQGGCYTPKPGTNRNDKSQLRESETGNYVDDMKYDPANPHTLRGEKLFPGDRGRGLLITWDLTRCM